MTTTLDRTRRFVSPLKKSKPQLGKILLHHFPDVPSAAVQDRASRIKRHPDRRLHLHERRHDELHWIDVHVQECWPRLRQPILDGSFKPVCARNRLAPETQCAQPLQNLDSSTS
jgi:hypothetical protein